MVEPGLEAGTRAGLGSRRPVIPPGPGGTVPTKTTSWIDWVPMDPLPIFHSPKPIVLLVPSVMSVMLVTEPLVPM